MELPSKLSEQIAFKTRPQIEEHMLNNMDKGVHEEQLSQPLQTNKRQFKIAITFLTGCNGIFNVKSENNELYIVKSISDDDFSVIKIPEGAYELEVLRNEIKRNMIMEDHFTEVNYLSL